ncbi:MAG: 7,8-dihydro-6-hydroxymethylpterin dimethyltransferase [Promethearchaeota archaeon]|nr:MAG: 7,8-dihydro-6-hydroxymethylpterin dimethyltransferase [Candidatus Lokiarchaeota archaeon]
MYHLDGTDILKEKYYHKTKSVCPECLDKIDAEVYEEDDEIWMKKECPKHGEFKDKISSSAKYYKWTHYAQKDDNGNIEWQFLKNGEANPPDCKMEDPRGCPYNCGLCDEHLSTCSLALIDLTNRCNFNCNFCYANVRKAGYLIEPSMEELERVMRHFREKPIPAPAIMFTGGEPSVRADFPDICKMAKDLGFKEVICATNGYGFQRKKGGLDFTKECFEKGLDTLYLQFDGINDATLEKTRGIKNLFAYKERVIENCRKAGLTSVVLVQTVVKGITDIEIGNVIQYAIDNIDVVRGIVYQPVSLCGRITAEDMEDIRITNADVIKEVDKQTGGKIGIENAWYPLTTIVEFGRIIAYLADVEPVEFTCHPDCGFATYLAIDPETNEMVPIMDFFDPLKIVDFSNKFWEKIKHKEKEQIQFFENFLGDIGKTLDKGVNWLDKQQLKARFLAGMLQYTKKPGKLMEMFSRILINGEWESISAFTHGTLLISSMHFQDAYNMNIERTKRCIVHFGVAMPDGSVYEAPFCTMNTLHRPHIEKQVAKKLTAKVENEFDTSKGERVLDVSQHDLTQQQEVAHNGGTKKKE